jgi:hypothetical protein
MPDSLGYATVEDFLNRDFKKARVEVQQPHPNHHIVDPGKEFRFYEYVEIIYILKIDNTGPVTLEIVGWDSFDLKHPNGDPLEVGVLKAGMLICAHNSKAGFFKAYTVDLKEQSSLLGFLNTT